MKLFVRVLGEGDVNVGLQEFVPMTACLLAV